MGTRTLRNNNGMTLLEVMIAIGIFALVVEAAVAGYLHVFSQSKRSISRSSLEQTTHYLNNYFIHRIESVGGGSIRPWVSIWVEDGAPARASYPDGAGSDRITVAEKEATLAECPIVGVTAPDILVFDAPAGVCCLTPAHDNRQIMLVRQSSYSQQYLTAVNTVACTAQVSGGQGVGGIHMPPAAFAGWVGGMAVVVEISTLYLDPLRRELREHRDLNNNLVADAGEDKVLADNVMDLQLALGYDSNPRDARILDTRDQNDEWLHNINHPDDALGAPGGGLRNALRSDLRMIALGLVLGEQIQVPPYASVSLLNGPVRNFPGWQLKGSVVQFRFRGVGIFYSSG